MFSMGNDEIAKCEPLKEFEKCNRCGEFHKVMFGEKILEDDTREPSDLAYVYCNEKTYLIGIKGRRII